MMSYYKAGKRLAAKSRQRFKEQMQKSKIVEILGAGHSIYITHADEVEKIMRSFLYKIE